jgi:signal peptidase I
MAKRKPAATAPRAPARKPKVDRAESVRAFIAEWTVTIILLLFGTTTLLQPFVVPSGSMEDTVLIGDHMIVDKLAYAPPGPVSRWLLPYTPIKRGDVVVFKYPPNVRENYIKRVIGMPGDRIHFVNKDLYLNGKKMDEPYVVHKSPYIDSYRDNFPAEPNMMLPESARRMLTENVKNGELVVPDGFYFVMGDNRDNSSDSRYWGFVPKDNIVGKPAIIFWSYDAPTEQLADPNIISLDHLLDLAQHFFTKTRWSRTFRIVRGYPLQ